MPKYLTDKQETIYPIADLNNCPLGRRRQFLPLHHRACAGGAENTISIIRIYEKANGKRQYQGNLTASSFLERLRTSYLATDSTSRFEPVHTPSAHCSGTAVPLANCERLRNDNLLTTAHFPNKYEITSDFNFCKSQTFA